MIALVSYAYVLILFVKISISQIRIYTDDFKISDSNDIPLAVPEGVPVFNQFENIPCDPFLVECRPVQQVIETPITQMHPLYDILPQEIVPSVSLPEYQIIHKKLPCRFPLRCHHRLARPRKFRHRLRKRHIGRKKRNKRLHRKAQKSRIIKMLKNEAKNVGGLIKRFKNVLKNAPKISNMRLKNKYKLRSNRIRMPRRFINTFRSNYAPYPLYNYHNVFPQPYRPVRNVINYPLVRTLPYIPVLPATSLYRKKKKLNRNKKKSYDESDEEDEMNKEKEDEENDKEDEEEENEEEKEEKEKDEENEDDETFDLYSDDNKEDFTI